MPRFRQTIISILVFVTVIFSLIEATEAGNKRRRKKKKKARHYRFYAVVFFLALFAPAIFTFVKALIKDPAVPKLIKAAADVIKKRGLSFLGKSAGNVPEPTSQRPRSD